MEGLKKMGRLEQRCLLPGPPAVQMQQEQSPEYNHPDMTTHGYIKQKGWGPQQYEDAEKKEKTNKWSVYKEKKNNRER